VNLDLRFFQVGFGLLVLGGTFLGVALVLGLFLVNLMRQVVVFGLSFAGQFQLTRVIELGTQVSGMNGGPVLNELGHGEISLLALCPGHVNFQRLDGLDGSSDPYRARRGGVARLGGACKPCENQC